MVTLFALAYLHIDDTVLLARRTHQNFGSGLYSLIGGKVEAGETALKAIQREVLEETALDIPESAFELVHTFHRKGTETELIALVFKADIAALPEPINNEPDKHDDMRFFKINALPQALIPAHKQALLCIQEKRIYSQHGW